MRDIIFCLGVVVMTSLTACAGAQTSTAKNNEDKHCESEIRVGSRIPKVTCYSDDEEAMRDEMERQKMRQSLHQPGSISHEKPGS